VITFLEVCIGAAVSAAAYALLGIGYNLAYSTIRVINFAQGQIAMIGSMVYATVWGAGVPVPLALLIALLVSGAVAAVIERGVLSPIIRSRYSYQTHQVSLLATAAVGLIIDNIAQDIWGPQLRATKPLLGAGILHVGSLVVSSQQLTAIGGAVVAMALAWYLLQFTPVGLQIRAIAANSRGAVLQGIGVARVVTFSFIISGILGGFAGILLSALNVAQPSVGLNLSVLGLITTMLGGLGNMRRLIPAAFAMGLLQSIFSTYVSSQYGNDLALVVAFAYLLVSWIVPSRRGGQGRVITLQDQVVV
jgi:branched-chain amino acid transport system permease protein